MSDGANCDRHGHDPLWTATHAMLPRMGCHVMLVVAFEADAAQRNHLVIAFDLVGGLLNDDRIRIFLAAMHMSAVYALVLRPRCGG
jgi:hypothetical protein